MNINIEKKNGITVVKSSGRLDIHSSLEFKKKVRDLISQGEKTIIIDLADVDFIDSSGLGALVACLKSAHQINGTIGLARLIPEARMVLEITRLHHIFHMYDSIEDAIHGLTQTSTPLL